MVGGIDKTKMKRVFTGITLSSNDIKTIAARFAEVGPPLAMKANAYRLTDIDELAEVVAEDVVIDRLTIMVFDAGGAALEFSWEPSFLQVQADPASPRVREPFDAIVALLQARPSNGFHYNVIELSPAGTWTAPPASSVAVTAEPEPSSEITPPSARSGVVVSQRVGIFSRWWKRIAHPRRDRVDLKK